jgi:hypothetical protein
MMTAMMHGMAHKAHWAKGEAAPRTWAKATLKHLAQALFVALDFDAEAIVGFYDTYFVDYFVWHSRSPYSD